MKLSRHKTMLAHIVISACVVLLVLELRPSAAQMGNTFAKIRATGMVRCGVGEALRGFAQKDAQGRWTGLNVDFCRATLQPKPLTRPIFAMVSLLVLGVMIVLFL